MTPEFMEEIQRKRRRIFVEQPGSDNNIHYINNEKINSGNEFTLTPSQASLKGHIMSCEEESEAGKSGFSRRVNSSLSVSLWRWVFGKWREFINDWRSFFYFPLLFSSRGIL